MSKVVEMKGSKKDVKVTKDENSKRKGLTQEEVSKLSDKKLKENLESLEKEANEYAKKLAEKKFAVKFEDDKIIKDLKRHFEKHCKWTYQDAPLLLAAYESLNTVLKEGGVDDEGNVYLQGKDLNSIYSCLQKTEGAGYFDARRFISLLTQIGKALGDAIMALQDENQKLRDIHTDLSLIDAEMDIRGKAKQQGIKVENPSKSSKSTKSTKK